VFTDGTSTDEQLKKFSLLLDFNPVAAQVRMLGGWGATPFAWLAKLAGPHRFFGPKPVPKPSRNGGGGGGLLLLAASDADAAEAAAWKEEGEAKAARATADKEAQQAKVAAAAAATAVRGHLPFPSLSFRSFPPRLFSFATKSVRFSPLCAIFVI